MIKSRSIRITLSALALSAVALGLSATSAMAEQIRLSDGRIIQGEVVGQVTDQGFLFKLTRTGGQAFFRWSQVNRDDEARLRNIKDPDADIKLVVYIQGDRINTIFGDAFEGIVEQQADHYLVKSLRNPRGRRVPLDEVQETDGVQKNVLIDARVMHPPLKVLELRDEETPPDSAQDWYASARLAEHLGLYRESQERLTKCLELQPTSKLLEVSEAMKLRLDELVKQEMVLSLLDATRKVAEGEAFAQAKYELEESLKGSRMGTKPTGAIKDTIEAQLADVELAYTKWVIDEWHDYAGAAARKWVRENKEATVNEAMQFGRRGLEQELLKEMVKKSRGSLDAKLLQDAVIARDIRDRMALRLTEPWVKRLRNRRADFGRDGWYQAVGGNLPNAGRVKPANQAAPAPGGQPPRFPGIPGGNPNRPRGGGGDGFGVDEGGLDEKKVGVPVAKMGGIQFQEAPPAPPGGAGGAGGAGGGAPAGGIGNIDPKALEEIIKRLAGGGNQPEQPSVNEGGPRRPSRRYAEDDARMKVPNETIPSLQEWWEKLSDSRKVRWVLALYARDGGTMDIVREDYNSTSYR